MAEAPPAVLITGCSTGIGRATAIRLAESGRWTVYPTARRLSDLADLERTGASPMMLDVADESSMAAAVSAIESQHGQVDVLINNAGYSQSGAIETVPMDLVRRQFETNVFGLVRLTQLVLPAMRRQRRGRIVNMSSMGGRLTFPGGGIYHATKYAVEAISDVLRFEVRGFGIKIVMIEPGLIRTEFAHAAAQAMESLDEGDGAYTALNRRVIEATRNAYVTGKASKLSGSPDDVARVIERAILARRPRTRYMVSASAPLFINQRRILGDRAWDRFLRSVYPSPGE